MLSRPMAECSRTVCQEVFEKPMSLFWASDSQTRGRKRKAVCVNSDSEQGGRVADIRQTKRGTPPTPTRLDVRRVLLCYAQYILLPVRLVLQLRRRVLPWLACLTVWSLARVVKWYAMDTNWDGRLRQQTSRP